MDFMQFILKNNLILVAILWVIGLAIRKTEKVDNVYIIFILFVISIGLMFLRVPTVTTGNFYNIITQSILVAGGAVLVNETPKQLKKKFGNTISNKSTYE